MIKVVAFILLLGLVHCTRREETRHPLHSSLDSTGMQVSVKPNDFYSMTRIYGDYESDSLLLPAAIKKRILRRRGKEISQQPYGGGDCWGKIRRFVLAGDTIAIDKHNCGEYGFGNAVFIKKGDSLRTIVTYEINYIPDENQPLYVDMLEIVEFKQDNVSIQTSSKSITDWNAHTLDRAPQKFDQYQGGSASEDYENYRDRYKKLKTRELVRDE